MSENIRPTKKQKLLLEFIAKFIAEHGYSPSYREIMVGCDYNSVATVALHVRNLIARGHLVKRGRSARSLEVVESTIEEAPKNKVSSSQEKWLIKAIEAKFIIYENSPNDNIRDQLYVLVGALKALDLEDAMRSFLPRLPKV
ncbi:MAG: hypothetical protein M3Q79_03415 [bacterium]|nr:hypothetical protein [bacterium]